MLAQLNHAAGQHDRIAVMKSGEVVEHGRTKDIFAAPQHAYTNAWFHAAPGRTFAFAHASADSP
jgi:peptide/nickel transport system ATP-binding protein